ncbi:MAG: LamB/YcsF family protein [Acidimicrobiales bacterium]
MDLNADVGEGFGAWRMGDDGALMGVVSSANVACGFHAGGPAVMAGTLRAAVAGGVVVGAHVSYPDLVGFGRRAMDVAPSDIACDVTYQLGALEGMARVAGTRVCYVKAHGALYHRICVEAPAARALVGAVAGFDPTLALLSAPSTILARAAEACGLRVVAEAFADRAYRGDGTLVARSEPDSVICEVSVVVARAVRLAVDGSVLTVDGSVVELATESICLHGDTPGAASLASAVRDGLGRAGVPVRSFIG